jgi:homoserine kinase type II
VARTPSPARPEAVHATPDSAIEAVLGSWGIAFSRRRPDIALTGSPERSEFRTAIEDRTGAVFVLERIRPEACDRRRRINTLLRALLKAGVPAVHPYLLNQRESSIVEQAGAFWQCMPFIAGEPLPRPDYVFQAWRGRALGDWLVRCRRAVDGLPELSQGTFSIRDYCRSLHARLLRVRPAVAEELREALTRLERGLFPVHDSLPTALCHGDYHPLNVIWGDGCLNSVLDWEFMGRKPELYDVANMVGCAGMERPDALLGELVLNLLATVREGNTCQPVSWSWLPDYILALRFAWMREWVLRNDRKMIDLEITYMQLLLDNRDLLRDRWGLPTP